MKSVLTVLALLLCVYCFSQAIQMHKTLGGAHFQRDTVYLSHHQVSEILAIDSQATNEFKVALKNYRVGGLMGFSGAVLLAIPLATALSGGEPEWIMAGGGAALLLGSIPFSRGFKNHAEKAINGYNARHEQTPQTRLYFSGAGVTLKF